MIYLVDIKDKANFSATIQQRAFANPDAAFAWAAKTRDAQQAHDPEGDYDYDINPVDFDE